jgi:hypothetical protein
MTRESEIEIPQSMLNRVSKMIYRWSTLIRGKVVEATVVISGEVSVLSYQSSSCYQERSDIELSQIQ